MKQFLAILWLIFAASGLGATTFTAKAAGDWNSGSTWNGGDASYNCHLGNSTAGSMTIQPATMCSPDGTSPDGNTWVTAEISPITVSPNSTVNTDITNSGTLVPSGGCAAGSWLYTRTTITANTIGAPTSFSYNGISVQGAN